MPKGEHRKGQPPRQKVEIDPEKREALLAMADSFVSALKSGDIPIPEKLLEALSNARQVDVLNMDETRLTEGLSITRREAEVLAVLSHGMSYTEAGVILGISSETIQTILKNAKRKLKAKDTKHAIATALRRGIIV